MTFAISKRDKCLLVGLIGVAFLVLAWFYGYTPLQEKTVALEEENVTLKAKSDLYQAINANLATYESNITKMEDRIVAITNSYPVYIGREDEILFLAGMENTHANDIAVESITMSAVEEIVVELPAPVEETAVAEDAAEGAQAQTETVEAAPATTEIHMFKQPVNYSFRCTYKGFKDMVKYLYSQTDKKSIEGMSLAYDSATGNLAGYLDLNQFYMTGVDKLYQPVSVPFVPKGVYDVFHTINGAEGVNAVVEEGAEE